MGSRSKIFACFYFITNRHEPVPGVDRPDVLHICQDLLWIDDFPRLPFAPAGWRRYLTSDTVNYR